VLYLSGKVVPGLPSIRTPDTGYLDNGLVWAADNGCYANPKEYSDERYLAWLDRQTRERCLFATAPDVWGDWEATLERGEPMFEPIRELGFNVAFVAQDGLEPDYIPWTETGAMFIGGSDEWRHSDVIPELIREARLHGLWVHMGRVNSWRRFDWARSIGCQSADGTVLRFDQSRDVAGWMERAKAQPQLWDRRLR
jgi:hypothetical protein